MIYDLGDDCYRLLRSFSGRISQCIGVSIHPHPNLLPSREKELREFRGMTMED